MGSLHLQLPSFLRDIHRVSSRACSILGLDSSSTSVLLDIQEQRRKGHKVLLDLMAEGSKPLGEEVLLNGALNTSQPGSLSSSAR